MITRTKYIHTLHDLIGVTTMQYIAIVGEPAVDIQSFLMSLEASSIFEDLSILVLESDTLISKPQLLSKKKIDLLIISDGDSRNISEIRAIIDSQSFKGKVLFRLNTPGDDSLFENFILSALSFREYAEYRGNPIDISLVMSGAVDIQRMNTLRDEYIRSSGYPLHIEDISRIFGDFEEKCTVMKQELYKKEYDEFTEYMRTLAMNTGNLFKADGIAKLLGISRRKVHKYTELLMRHAIIRPIGPWGDDPQTETTRHVKIYFTELFYIHALLSDLYYQGQMKQGVIENFVFLELSHKLSESHDFAFYRKKSGAEITFILTNKENTLITPIEVILRDSEVLSQSMKAFDMKYHHRVEHYMILNHTKSTRKSLEEKQVMILPHIAL